MSRFFSTHRVTPWGSAQGPPVSKCYLIDLRETTGRVPSASWRIGIRLLKLEASFRFRYIFVF